MKKILILPLLAISISITSCDNTPEKTLETIGYQNPVFTLKEFPDPSVFRDDDGKYWAFATEGDYAMSYDLVHWEYSGNVIMSAGSPNWATNGAHLWAPDIQKINNRYICYYSMSKWDDPNPGIGFAYTDDINEGYWTDGGKLFLSSEIGVHNSIDPMVLCVDEYVYMYWGSFNGIFVIELESDGMSLLGNSLKYANISKKLLAWSYEGAYVHYKNGFYYLFLSQGGCCNSLGSSYNVVVYRSESPTGPFVNQFGQDALNAQGYQVIDKNYEFIGPGHNDVISDDAGDDYLVYHSYSRKYPDKRMMCIDKLIYDEHGWPSVETISPSYDYIDEGPKILLSQEIKDIISSR